MNFPFLRSQWKILSEDARHLEALCTPVEKQFSLAWVHFLRKTLLTSTVGYGITALRIRGISSEFEHVPGLSEDLVSLFPRLRNLSFSVQSSELTHLLRLHVKGSQQVLAGHLICPEGVRVLQPQQVLWTTQPYADLEMEFRLEGGTGYVHLNTLGKHWIPLETNLNPIEHVSYQIHPYAHYEEIVFHLRTNGSLPPRQALRSALEMWKGKSESLLDSLT